MRSHSRLSAVVLTLAVAWLGGCGAPPPESPDCGEHGEAHGDHCHCDSGFTEVDGTCVPGDPAPDTCGEHGEAHGDHCHCDAGYTEVEGVCVSGDPAPDTCGEHGEAHGDHCHCDAGYTEVEGVCVSGDPEPDTCGEHGEAHGDHCHCDTGYTEVEGVCVSGDPEPDTCGEHGEAHGDHCHCDAGYTEVEGVCVAVIVDASCGAHGHRHEDVCVCLAGHIYLASEDTCVPTAPPVPAPAPTYLVLPLSEEGTQSGVNALNDHRQITGNKKTADSAVILAAYLQEVRTNDGTHTLSPLEDVGILPASTNLFSRPFDINAQGVIVGESGNSDPVLPFAYASDIGLVQLPLPAGSTSAVAHGINDAGQIVGIGNSRAIRWANAQSIPTELPLLEGATQTHSRAWKINADGDVAGHARTAAGRQHAVLWPRTGGARDLGSLNPAHVSEALDVNGVGTVVGKSVIGVVPGSQTGTLQTQAFVWDGAMRGLGLLDADPSAIHSVAAAINDDGWIVGQVEQIAGFAKRAVLWRDGQILDLNELLPADSGWVLSGASDINVHGDIVGRGTLFGVSRPFIMIRID